jgi:endonuclease-3|tara:strand:- start:528 stop:1166 length:639 start_codon:yes stop_codon:yes gene_type:complete
MRIATIEKVFNLLSRDFPNPQTELKYINRYTFLISVMLSAQATDISVNKATRKLFEIVKNSKEMVELGETNLKRYIKTIGLYNTKAKNIIRLSKMLLSKYNNKIPKDFESLISLPGVGNKTASVYQNSILNVPRIAVDTHVFRVSNRIGLTKSRTVDLTQISLEKIVPKKWLMTAHHILIFHGRQICKARKPLCNICSVNKICYYRRDNLQS